MKPVWIVDDEESIRFVLNQALSKKGIPVEEFASAEQALEALSNSAPPQVIVSDIRMPGQSGLDFLKTVKEKDANLPVIIMTAFQDVASAASAFREGAFDCLAKPFKNLDEPVSLIRKAIAQRQRTTKLEDSLDAEKLGWSKPMTDLMIKIGNLATSVATVLITGQSGTGKELVARDLHRHSKRSDKPFIAINTAAIPKELLESELFGHERGSFTGAQASRQGRFEQAAEGTLFLDEIGDMPLDLQTKLLRVISDNRFYRIGGQQPLTANVRIITATHRDLQKMVAEGTFREDLFHRLNVIRLEVPPLKDRKSYNQDTKREVKDIEYLAPVLLKKSAVKLEKEPKKFTSDALDYLCQLDWPGNVRQLENVCYWVTVMTSGEIVDKNDLPPDLLHQLTETSSVSWANLLGSRVESLLQSGKLSIHQQLEEEFERVLIIKSLDFTRGKRIEASKLLGIGRNTLTRKIQELGIEKKEL